MKGSLERLWSPEGKAAPLSLKLLTSLLAAMWKLAVGFRNYLFDRGFVAATRLPVPVISVGNLTSGGTGKTSLVIALARYYRQKGFTPAVLSRGYGGKSRAPVTLVSDGKEVLACHVAVGEEPVMMARLLPGVPVLVGAKRTLTGRLACEVFRADLLILDDAFQHRLIARDLDIVLLDGRHPFGNGRLLPRGSLREPSSALQRADVLVFTGSPLFTGKPGPGLGAGEGKPIFQARQCPTMVRHPASGAVYPVEFLQGKKLYYFCGLGAPERFEETLLSLKAVIAGRKLFPDHHRYCRKDLAAVIDEADSGGAELIITTEKDEVKVASFPDYLARIHVLVIVLEIDPGKAKDWRELLDQVMIRDQEKGVG
jgi:tetraacyldisaccharide 4'-kinase